MRVVANLATVGKKDFKDQLERSPEGWYRAGLLWKSEIPDLPDNEQGSK